MTMDVWWNVNTADHVHAQRKEQRTVGGHRCRWCVLHVSTTVLFKPSPRQAKLHTKTPALDQTREVDCINCSSVS